MRYAVKIMTLAALLLSFAVITAAQNPPLAFEVASVKPSPPLVGRLVSFALCHGTDTKLPVFPAASEISIPALGRCLMKRATLTDIISVAYPSSVAALNANDRISAGPAWASSDGFDIEAKAENAASATNEQLLSMLRRLLAERFKLQFHTVPKQVSGFALTVAKDGPKLKPGKGDFEGFTAGERMSASNASMGGLARMLSTTLRAPVLDQTGLKGGYAFSYSRPTPNDPSPGSIFTVLREDLGLKLESAKVPVDVIMIDHAEKPCEN
jgi:uncharacterized protein (TIGR03435 family)